MNPEEIINKYYGKESRLRTILTENSPFIQHPILP